MVELRTDILHSPKDIEDLMKFDVADWVDKKINEIIAKFNNGYVLSNITVGISGGIPSGVTGSLTVTLTPRQSGITSK
jgi:NH3-dependent NAD+ synthetase